MPAPFNLRHALRKTSPQLLRPLLAAHGIDDSNGTIAWDQASHALADTVHNVLMEVKPGALRAINHVLGDAWLLLEDDGAQVLAEEVHALAPHRAHEFDALKSHADRALWAHLHAPIVFQRGVAFAYMDRLSRGRYWYKRNGLAGMSLPDVEAGRVALRSELTEFYWENEKRGRRGIVEHYSRPDRGECFHAYLEHYADHADVLDDDERLARSEERRVFEVIFVFDPTRGTLDTFAQGGREVIAKLQRIFGRSVLGVDIGDADPLKPAYRLDHLLKPDRLLGWDPADPVESASIVRLRLAMADRPGEYVEIGINPDRGSSRIDLAIAEALKPWMLDPNRVRVTQASFRVTFTAGFKARSATFSVSAPSTCDLKSKPQAIRQIGERCLRLWKVTDA